MIVIYYNHDSSVPREHGQSGTHVVSVLMFLSVNHVPTSLNTLSKLVAFMMKSG